MSNDSKTPAQYVLAMICTSISSISRIILPRFHKYPTTRLVESVSTATRESIWSSYRVHRRTFALPSSRMSDCNGLVVILIVQSPLYHNAITVSLQFALVKHVVEDTSPSAFSHCVQQRQSVLFLHRISFYTDNVVVFFWIVQSRISAVVFRFFRQRMRPLSWQKIKRLQRASLLIGE